MKTVHLPMNRLTYYKDREVNTENIYLFCHTEKNTVNSDKIFINSFEYGLCSVLSQYLSFFFPFFLIKFTISILRLQTFRLNRFYERKWKGQDIVELILCPLLDEVNLF